jgi:hypothetical protein
MNVGRSQSKTGSDKSQYPNWNKLKPKEQWAWLAKVWGPEFNSQYHQKYCVKKKGEEWKGGQKSNKGDEMIEIYYMHGWKYHNEIPLYK